MGESIAHSGDVGWRFSGEETVYYVVLNSHDESPGPWATAREAEGWDGVAAPDHLVMEGVGGMAHPFVSLGVMAAVTSGIGLFTVFANNLVRSPVEFAQAALSLQRASGGRFEAGLGAGWQAGELIGAGLPYPAPRERARRFREAVQVVRQLLVGGCKFEGEYYCVDLPAIGPVVESAPRLGAALSGRWTIANIGPLVDAIEIATMGPAFRAGAVDMAGYYSMQVDELRAMVDASREANPHATVGIGLQVAAGKDPIVDFVSDLAQGGAFAGLAGEPARVADSIREFAGWEVDRLTICGVTATTAAELAPHLLA